MIKPLFINRPCYFDHSAGGECLRAFLKEMSGNKWSPVIYASDRAPLVGGVPKFAVLTHEKRYYRYMAAVIRRCLVPDLTWLPGFEWWSWGKGCAKQIIHDIRKKEIKPDYIHSICFPVASHWAALKVKQKTGLPWVMQFYDPWAENPYRPFKTQWFKKKDWAMERDAVEAADLIIHDNEAIAAQWRERYGEEIGKKIIVLPLTVPLPSVSVRENTHKSGDVLTISHIGNFMLNRTSQPFIKAVASLIRKSPEYRDKLRVNYIGQVTEPEKELIKELSLTDIFNLTGSISADACVNYYKKTDLFLAVDGVNKDNLFFPSKILKYYYFRRPILGITPEGSVLDCELHKSNHTSIRNSDVDGISDYLERALNNYETLLDFDASYWHRFEPKNVVEEYESIIKDMLSKCKQ